MSVDNESNCSAISTAALSQRENVNIDYYLHSSCIKLRCASSKTSSYILWELFTKLKFPKRG
jgi:hypothetical protein